MGLADTAQLAAELSLKGNFASQLTAGKRALGQFDAKLTDTQGRAYKAGQQIGTGIKNAGKIAAVGIGLLATQVALGLRSLVELEQQQAQTAAVLKSTGGAAGITEQAVGRLSEKYEALNATIGDEFIRSAQNMLLTFTEIRKDAFEPALAAVLDINTAMGGGPEGLQKAAIQVGKALNDPAKGFTALRRVGVSFSADQEKRIKALQKEGKLFEAQGIILAELNKEFGGSFIARGGTTGGKVAKFTDSIEDLQRALATALLPTVAKISDRLSAFLGDPSTVATITELGDKIGSLFSDANINTGGQILTDLFRVAKEAAPAIQSAAEVTGRIIGTAVEMFRSLPPELQTLAVAGLAVNKLTGGLVTNIAGGLIGAVLKQLVSANVNIAATNVNVVGGGGVPGVPGGKGGGLLGGAASLIIPVAIAGITVAAAAALTEAIDPGITQKLKDAGVSTNRDPRRFGPGGNPRSPTDILAASNRERAAIEAGNRQLTQLATQTRGVSERIRASEANTLRGLHGVSSSIDRKDLSVSVSNSVFSTFVVNGRKFVAATSRYRSSTGDPRHGGHQPL